MRGRRGILLKKPHLFVGASSSAEGETTCGDCDRGRVRLLGDLVEAGLGLGGGRPGSCVRSKTCKVDLSDVTARVLLSGENAMAKTKAGSTPRRSSASLAQLPVLKMRMRVPVSEAVAKRFSSCARSSARRLEA